MLDVFIQNFQLKHSKPYRKTTYEIFFCVLSDSSRIANIIPIIVVFMIIIILSQVNAYGLSTLG